MFENKNTYNFLHLVSSKSLIKPSKHNMYCRTLTTMMILMTDVDSGGVSVPLTDYSNGKTVNCLFLKITITTALS